MNDAPARERAAGVIIVAAGLGLRLGAGMPKALVPVGGEPLIVRAVRNAAAARCTGDIVVVAPAGHEEQFARLLPAGTRIVPGGAERTDSVAAGLAALPDGCDVALVHDAARACAPAELFDAVARAVDAGPDAVVPALAVTDTVKQVDAAGNVIRTPDRTTLRAVQTPQGFRRSALAAAHRAGDTATDDAALVERGGGRALVIDGDPLAMKVTTRADVETIERLLAGMTAESPHTADEGRRHMTGLPRTGMGVDVHAYSTDPAREMHLAGLLWPGEIGLVGHSDADAAAHACVDAVLSAAGLGDIGSMFGTDRPEIAGASGARLLAEAAREVRAAGFDIGNIAVQIIGNRPAFAPRRREAEEVLSAAAGAPVSASATTSDGLGPAGRGEGVAAIATALIVPRD